MIHAQSADSTLEVHTGFPPMFSISTKLSACNSTQYCIVASIAQTFFSSSCTVFLNAYSIMHVNASEHYVETVSISLLLYVLLRFNVTHGMLFVHM